MPNIRLRKEEKNNKRNAMKGTKGKEREINLADYLWVQCVVELGLEEKDKVQCVVKLGLPVKRHDGDAYFFL